MTELASSSTALRPLAAAERLAALSKEEAAWAKKVERARAACEALELSLARMHAQLGETTGPLMAECRQVDERVHEAFAELLAGRSRGRAEVRALYLDLQERGLISDRRSAEDVAATFGFDAEAFFGDTPPTPAAAAPDATVDAPKHKGRDKQASRDLFRKLAEWLHPDKSHASMSAEERAQREAAMKEASAAYGAGDLARLMALETAWAKAASGGKPSLPSAPDLEARCEAMRARIAELRTEHRELRQDLRLMRKEPDAALLADVKRFGYEEVCAQLTNELEEELGALEDLLSFVASYRDKRISLREFLEGPVIFDDEDERALLAHLEDFFVAVSEPPSRGARGGKRSTGRNKRAAKKPGRRRA